MDPIGNILSQHGPESKKMPLIMGQNRKFVLPSCLPHGKIPLMRQFLSA
jgi:hypothetical protein